MWKVWEKLRLFENISFISTIVLQFSYLKMRWFSQRTYQRTYFSNINFYEKNSKNPQLRGKINSLRKFETFVIKIFTWGCTMVGLSVSIWAVNFSSVSSWQNCSDTKLSIVIVSKTATTNFILRRSTATQITNRDELIDLCVFPTLYPNCLANFTYLTFVTFVVLSAAWSVLAHL